MLSFATDKPLTNKVYNAYPDLSEDLLTDMYFDWEMVNGNWILRRISAKTGNQPHDGLEHDITLKYKVKYGNPDSGKDKYYLFWNANTFANSANLIPSYDRIVPESNGASEDNYVFYLYGPDPSDPKSSFKDEASAFYYNQDVKGESTRPVHNTGKDGKNISGTFIRNHVSGAIAGAVVYNDNGILGNISGEFIGNYARSNDLVQGGIIFNNNSGKIGTISGTFIGNYSEQQNTASDPAKQRKTASGGVIYNYQSATIEKIDGFFAGNYLYTTVRMNDVIAGTIANYGTITQGVHGTYIANFAYAQQTANSGVLRNFSTSSTYAVIGACDSVVYNGVTYNDVSISGTFIGNFARGINGDAFGGVMRNNGEIQGSIIGDYIGNYAITDGTEGHVSIDLHDEQTGASRAQGGVFYNTIKIANVEGEFAEVKLSKIDARFERNYTSSKWGVAEGGAIFNENAQIDDIVGTFTGNYAVSEQYIAQGGAIFNNWVDVKNEKIIAEIGNIGTETNQVLFDANYVKGKVAEGGAIYVASGATAKNIFADFKGNKAISVLPQSASSNEVYTQLVAAANGGAIYVADDGEIQDIRGSFIENTITSANDARGGAIYVADGGSIGEIIADFIDNKATGTGAVRGGALFVSYGSIGQITGDFIGNSAMGDVVDQTYGGAMRLDGSMIQELTASFRDNKTNGAGGAISLTVTGFIEKVSGDFINNTSGSDGGAVHNNGTIGYLGTILTNDGKPLEDDFSNVKRHEAEDGQKLGRIYTESDETQGINKAGYLEYDGTIVGGFVNTNFKDNTIQGIDYNNGIRGKGGAIYTTDDLFITASEGKTVEFSGNKVYYTTDDGTTDVLQSALYVDNSKASDETLTIYLVAKENATLKFDDIIRGQEDTAGGFVLRLRGYTEKAAAHKDTTGTIILGNVVAESYTIMDDVRLKIGIASNDFTFSGEPLNYIDGWDTVYQRSDVFRRSHISVRSGLVDMTDLETTQYAFGSMTSYGHCFDYKNNGAAATATDVQKEYEGLYSVFAIDLDLDKQVADVITTFEVRGEDGAPLKQSQSKGKISLGAITFLTEDGTRYTPENETQIKVQILNLVVLQQNGKNKTTRLDKNGEVFAEYANSAPIELDEHFRTLKWEKSIMDSDCVLADGIALATTHTHNDSILITGWRDNLAAWAEMTDDPNDSKFEQGQWVWEGNTLAEERKVFNLTKNDPYHLLTRDVEDLKTSKKSGVIWAKDWTIQSEQRTNILDLNQKMLLTEVTQDQTGRLQNFNLRNVFQSKITNNGNLTLDTMGMESQLVINNENRLTLQGKMTVNNTITSANKGNKMIIDDESKVSKGETVIDIEGAIANQNITHRGTGALQEVAEQALPRAAANVKLGKFSTITNLHTTKADGATATDEFKAFQNNSLAMEGGRFNLFAMGANVLQLRNWEMSGGAIYVAQSTVDLKNAKMGGIFASGSTKYTGGDVWLNSMLISTDSKYDVTHVRFVNSEMGDAVKDNLRQTKKMGPKWEYLVTYNDTERADHTGAVGRNGYYTFSRTGNVNPTLQATPADELVGGIAQLMQVYDYSFEHAELFSATMDNTRSGHLRDYAVVTPVKGYKEAAAVSSSADSCPTNAAGQNRALWVRPYASYERMPLHNGPRVNATMYGALVGGDSSLREHASGWASVYSLYGTYMGSTLRYDGVRSRQDGLAMGGTGTFYRGNFYTALTGAVGTSFGRTNSAYGSEDFDMLIAGIASRTGYTLPLGSCKYVLQPTLLMSYTWVSTSDYTNAAGVHMSSDPLQVFQVHPYLKAIMFTDSGWNPYVTAGYVHNFTSGTQFRADGDKLPELSIDPYVEYSMGVQKTWDNGYTLYGQATGRNGGRNGAEVTVGVRWTW